MENKITFTNISEANVDSFSEKISELCAMLSGKRHAPDYWHWRYLSGPAGRGNLTIAIRNNMVVGKYGLSCLHLTVKGKTVTAGLMEGLLISSNERFWQCYRGLVENYNLQKQGADLAFSFGIAHSRVIELHKRLGVIDLGRVPIYLGFIDITKVLEGFRVPYPLSLLGRAGQAIMGLRTSKKKAHNLSICHIRSFDSSFDELWDNISKRCTVSVTRDAQYLNWRYAKSPSGEYKFLAAYNNERLEGVVVFCVTGCHNGSYILELFAREDNICVMRELLLEVVRELKTKKIGYITASFPTSSNAASALRSLRFKPWGTRIWSTHMIISSGSKTSFLPESELRNWYFSLGDWLAS